MKVFALVIILLISLFNGCIDSDNTSDDTNNNTGITENYEDKIFLLWCRAVLDAINISELSDILLDIDTIYDIRDIVDTAKSKYYQIEKFHSLINAFHVSDDLKHMKEYFDKFLSNMEDALYFLYVGLDTMNIDMIDKAIKYIHLADEEVKKINQIEIDRRI